MRTFCRILPLLLLCAFVRTATAGKINILDPNSYPATVITGSPFTIGGSTGFLTCSAGELPAGISADGCFAGVNGTGDSWSGLELRFPNAGTVLGQSFACNTDPSGFEIFSAASCVYDPASNSFDLQFTSGTIPQGQLFIITEDGVLPPGDFPDVTASVTFASTPEPSSWLLLMTGLCCSGAYGWARRRRQA